MDYHFTWSTCASADVRRVIQQKVHGGGHDKLSRISSNIFVRSSIPTCLASKFLHLICLYVLDLNGAMLCLPSCYPWDLFPKRPPVTSGPSNLLFHSKTQRKSRTRGRLVCIPFRKIPDATATKRFNMECIELSVWLYWVDTLLLCLYEANLRRQISPLIRAKECTKFGECCNVLDQAKNVELSSFFVWYLWSSTYCLISYREGLSTSL